MGQLSVELLGARRLAVSGLCSLSPTPGVRGHGGEGSDSEDNPCRLLLVSSGLNEPGRVTGCYEKYQCREF